MHISSRMMDKFHSTLFYDIMKGRGISILVSHFLIGYCWLPWSVGLIRGNLVYFLHLQFPDWNLDGSPAKVGAYVVECVIDDEIFELLDMDYYDETSVVMILRNHGE